MGLEAASFLNDLVPTNPVGATDQKAQGDDHIRLIKTVLLATFPGLAGRVFRSQTKSGNYSPALTDNLSVFSCTTNLSLTPAAAATLGNGWLALVYANGGDVTIDPNAAETVNGQATLVVPNGSSVILLSDGTNLLAFFLFKNSSGVDSVTGNVTLTVADVGRLKVISDTADVTIPAASALNIGDIIAFKSLTSKKHRIIPQGTDTIDGDGSATPYRIPSYSSFRIMKSAAGTFIMLERPSDDVGMVKPWFSTVLPRGWTWLNGVNQNRVNIGNLFDLWGTFYGVGDGSLTFGIPNGQDRVLVGQDGMGGGTPVNLLTVGAADSDTAGFDSSVLGTVGGNEKTQRHTHIQDSHTHSVPSGASRTSSIDYSTNGVDFGNPQTTGGTVATNQNAFTGQSGNVQPSLVSGFIVRI